MNVTIPVLVTEHKQKTAKNPVQIVRPLFFSAPVESAESVQRALNKLVSSLREQIERLGAEARHDQIAEICFAPALKSETIDFRLNLGAENFDCRYLFVSFAAFEKKLVFTPNLSDLWFELERGEDLKTRAETVLDDYFRRLERRDGRGSQNPARYNFLGKTWTTNVDFDVSLAQKYKQKTENFFALLGRAEVGSGAEELRKTGRCLDWLYPNELERVVNRKSELEKLTDFLESTDKRPVLILGQRQTGKTALVHEYVYSQVSKRSSPRQPERNVWLLAPQRLVSGMMYIGQWEERLLAILKEAKEKKHLLYFDDLLGLFFAGQSRNSDLSMAQVLKPYVERREIRILTEMTPETFRVLKERDRGFTDLFQVLRLDETDDESTLKIMLHVRRELEQKHDCGFALDALPVVLDLQRRYVRDAAFPGKAANFLKQLAVKFKEKEIGRFDVLREFTARSGLSVAFLDDYEKLDRSEVVKSLSRGLVGQTAAIEAAADAISAAKARLNDPNRPIATFLFLGATGVGKTEAAKQIASYLYGDAEKMLRFDMNEFVTAFDVARLVGTFDQPEGLLTSVVRKQPFAVVLLDEIEKAHPDVFNLLLQVMGDGRLTDALGRTTDFTNTIIILTSNLGAREANIKLGFRQTEETDAHVYRTAAEKFFRPEFFNRLDRVIGFERLSRADVEKIAEKQLQKVFSRDGLVRRNCKLQVDRAAMRLIVSKGYHPQLGARALKRAIEKHLVQPVGAHLSALAPEAPVIIRISAENEKFAVNVEEITLTAISRSVWQTHDFTDVNSQLDLVEDALDRFESEIADFKPVKDADFTNEIQAKYFLVREHIKRIERMIERAENWRKREENQLSNDGENQSGKPNTLSARSRTERKLVTLKGSNINLPEILRSQNLSFKLKEAAEENRAFGERLEDYLQDVWRETALLGILMQNLHKPQAARCAFKINAMDENGALYAENLIKLYKTLFEREIGLKTNETKIENNTATLLIEGFYAADFARYETGQHLIVSTRDGIVPLEISVEPNIDNNQNKIAPVIRIYDGHDDNFRFVLDARSALVANGILSLRELRAFVLAGLPPPAELS